MPTIRSIIRAALALALAALLLCAGCARAKPPRVVSAPTAVAHVNATLTPPPTTAPTATTPSDEPTPEPPTPAPSEPPPTALPEPTVVESPPTAVPQPPTAPPPAPTSPPAGEVTHVVQRGETLYGIAVRYGTTAAAIASRNGLADGNAIYAGQTLYIPAGSRPTAPGGTTHTVVAGETLASIARKYRTTVDEILALNPGITPSLLPVGAVLSIPAASAPAGRTHVVQPGETLYAIARRYGVEANALIAANGLANPNAIYAGQTLVIP